MAVSTNHSKKYRFSEDERVAMVTETVGGLRGVVAMPMGQGLLADFCKDQGAEAIVKGLRSTVDYAYEIPMATMNRHLTGVETVFLQADTRFTHLSSSLLKEVQSLGGDVDEYFPRAVLRRLLK